jgi:hypothetical protein
MRKRQVSRQATTVDPVLALHDHRERLEAFFEEARKVQEVTLQGVRGILETTAAHVRGISEQIAEEIEKLDEHCRKLEKKHSKSSSESEKNDRYAQGLCSIHDAAGGKHTPLREIIAQETHIDAHASGGRQMRSDGEEPVSPEPLPPKLENIDPKVAADIADRFDADNRGVYDDAEGYDDGDQRDAHRAEPDEHV